MKEYVVSDSKCFWRLILFYLRSEVLTEVTRMDAIFRNASTSRVEGQAEQATVWAHATNDITSTRTLYSI